MAKPEWGTKRICPNCGTRYYDMQKDPPTCPSCSTVFDPEALLKSRRARPIPVEETKKAPVKRQDDEAPEADTDEEEQVEEEVETTDDDADVVDIEDEDTEDVVEEDDEDVLLEDADELGDDDDVNEVVDVENDEDR